MPIAWPSERVVVTGGAGFLGSFVVEELRRRGAREIFIPRSKEYDLVDMDAVRLRHRSTRRRGLERPSPASGSASASW